MISLVASREIARMISTTLPKIPSPRAIRTNRFAMVTSVWAASALPIAGVSEAVVMASREGTPSMTAAMMILTIFRPIKAILDRTFQWPIRSRRISSRMVSTQTTVRYGTK